MALDPRLLEGLTPEERAKALEQAAAPAAAAPAAANPNLPPFYNSPKAPGYAGNMGAFQPDQAPTPAAPRAFQADVRKSEPPETAVAAATPRPVVPGLPAVAAAPATQGPLTPYESKNPESMYDKDIEFTHTLSRMLGMAGLGDKAMHARDLHMKLQSARIEDVGTQAQRAFLAGDVTKGIDMFNHVVPNGNKIVAYSQNPDGTFGFQLANGKMETRKGSDVSEALAAYTKPELIGAMMKDRAKTLAEFGKDAALAQLKGGMELTKELAVKQYGAQTAMALEQFKSTLHNQAHLTSTMDGQVYAAFPNGAIHRVEMKKNAMTNKIEPQLGPAMSGGQQQQPQQGTPVNAAAISIPLASQYAR